MGKRRFVIGDRHARYLRKAERADRLTPTQGESGQFNAEETPRIRYEMARAVGEIPAATSQGNTRTVGQGQAQRYRVSDDLAPTLEPVPAEYGGIVDVFNWFSAPANDNAWITIGQDMTYRWLLRGDCSTQGPPTNPDCPGWPAPNDDWNQDRPAVLYVSFVGKPDGAGGSCCDAGRSTWQNMPASSGNQSPVPERESCSYVLPLDTFNNLVELHVHFDTAAGVRAYLYGQSGPPCDGFVDYGPPTLITDPYDFDVTLTRQDGADGLDGCYGQYPVRISSSPV